MKAVLSVVSIVVVVILLLGFATGFVRGWVKSLSRFICTCVSFLIALFVSPAIATAFLNKHAVGTVLSFSKWSVDFKELISSLGGDGSFVDDLLKSEATTNNLAKAVMNVAINIVLFLLIFLVAMIISYIVYFIVSLIISHNKKKKGEIKEKTKSYWWLKVLGGGIGVLSAFVFCLAILNPLFGAMNICDMFIEQEEQTTASAYAVSSNSLMCGQLYYKDDEKIGGVETYIEKYAEFKNTYDKSVAGVLFKYTGMNGLGNVTFNYLTSVKQGKLDVKLTDEFVSIVNTYNAYKTTFIENEFNITNNKSIDNLLVLYNSAKESEIVKNYLVEFMPEFYAKWKDGDKFLGIACPVSGDYKEIFLDVLAVFNTSNFNQIDTNLVNLVKVIKVVNNFEVIQSVRENANIVDILSDNDGFIKDVIVQLSSTLEMRRTLPKVLNKTIQLVYDNSVNDGKTLTTKELTNAEIDAINWQKEGDTLENAIVKILNVYNNTKGKDSKALIDELKNIGSALDSARESKLISVPMKDFMLGFIDKIALEDDIKTTLKSNIETYWIIDEEHPENKNFKFEDMFEAIEKAAKFADELSKNNGEINLEDLNDVITTIINNEDMKNAVTEAISNNLIGQVTTNAEDAEILAEMLTSFVNNIDSTDDVQSELQAGQTLVELLQNSKDNGGNIQFTEGNEAQEASNIAQTIIESDAISAMVKENNNDEDALKKKVSSMNGDDVEKLKTAIDNYNTNGNSELEENKQALQKLFNTSGNQNKNS